MWPNSIKILADVSAHLVPRATYHCLHLYITLTICALCFLSSFFFLFFLRIYFTYIFV